MRLVEVEEEANSEFSEPEVRLKLCLMGFDEPLDGFQFDDNRVIYHLIRAICDWDNQLFEFDWDGVLFDDVQAPSTKLVRQARLAGTFEKARAKAGVDFDGRVHDLTGFLV